MQPLMLAMSDFGSCIIVGVVLCLPAITLFVGLLKEFIVMTYREWEIVGQVIYAIAGVIIFYLMTAKGIKLIIGGNQ